MSEELPEGWAVRPLGALVEPSKQKAAPGTVDHLPYLGLEHIESNSNKLLGAGNAAEVKSTTAVFHSGDVLYSKLRPYLNKVAVAPFDGVGSTEILVFSKRPYLESAYLQYYLTQEDVVRTINERAAGVQLPRVTFSKIADLAVPVPPLAEQKRIAEKIDALFKEVNNARERLAKVPLILRRFRQSVLAAACSGRLTEDWRAANPTGADDARKLITTLEQADPKGRRTPKIRCDLELFDLPDSWSWLDLRFLISPQEDFCYGVVQPGNDDPNGVPLIRSGDLHDLVGALPSLRRVPRLVDERHKRSRVAGGELLVTVVGANIGTVAVVPQAALGFNIARAVAKLPVREVSAEYVAFWLRSSTAFAWMLGDAREVARPTLNLEQLGMLPVPVPTRAEQTEIVRRGRALLALADEIESRAQAASASVNALPATILALAFAGRLVPTEAQVAQAEGRPFETFTQLFERLAAAPALSTREKPRTSGAAPTKGKQATEIVQSDRSAAHLFGAIGTAKRALTPEELFAATDGTGDVDSFYASLRNAIEQGLIRERVVDKRTRLLELVHAH